MERVEYLRMSELEGEFWWYRAMHAMVLTRLKSLGLPEGSKILDAASGTGGVLQYLSRALPGLSFTGIEFDAEAAALTEQKTGLAIVRGSVNEMPYADATFDAILSQDALYHRNIDETKMLQECYRCLVPGGYLILQVAAYAWMKSAHDDHVHGARRYTVTALRRIFQAAGFEIKDSGYWNSFLFPLMALSRLTVGKRKASSDVRAISPWQNRLLFAVLDAERRSGIRLPFGGTAWICARKPHALPATLTP
jgi:ubiquinone/menaquinone biosynthesis C-methylase UbiE